MSIRDFIDADGGSIISFTQPGKLKSERSAIENTIHVETSPGILGRTFAWAHEANRRTALEVVSDADLIVCHLLLRYHLHWVTAVARRKNIPYWIVPHGSLDPYVFSYHSLVKKTWFYLFGKSYLRNASRVIFATEKEKLKAGKFYSGDNCMVMHWPVQPIDNSRRGNARQAIRSKHGIGTADRILLYIGRLHSSKCPMETITAFAQAETPQTHLVIVGPDETISLQACQDLVNELGAKRVHLAGPVYGMEKNDYLLGSDAYISLSRKENFGYTTAEALAAGLPVILSPGNDLADELVPFNCGWMLQDIFPETVATAIEEFSSMTTEALHEMGQRGKMWALANLEFDNFAKKVRLTETESIQDFNKARSK